MSLQRESLKKYNPFGNKINQKGNSKYLRLKIQENYLLYIVFPFTTMLKWKQSAHDKGALGNTNTLLHKAPIQGHSVNPDILG